MTPPSDDAPTGDTTAPPLIARLDERSARVVVMGQGYVGLVVAMAAVEAGFGVVGFEPDAGRAARLAAGDSYIEDVADDRLAAALSDGYRPTTDPADLAGFDVAVISVPTPLRDRLPDLSFIEAASQQLATHLSPGALVVLESTTFPGTTVEVVGPLLEAGSGLVAGRDFHLGYSPERIDPGSTAWGLANTPKVVAGIDEASLDLVDAFFGCFVETRVRAAGCGEAELAKVIENTFRHVNIALVNEIAMFAHGLGVDVHDAIELAASKPFGFMRFVPGPGVGGHCLPIDPTYLSWRVKQDLGENFRFIELANDINDHMPHYVVRRVQSALNGRRRAVNGSRVVVLGAAYKPNVGDLRESPAIVVIDQLVALGADVVVVEPHAVAIPSAESIRHVNELDEATLAGADLVLVLTDHDAFDYDLVAASTAAADVPVLDTRSRLPRDAGGDVEHL